MTVYVDGTQVLKTAVVLPSSTIARLHRGQRRGHGSSCRLQHHRQHRRPNPYPHRDADPNASADPGTHPDPDPGTDPDADEDADTYSHAVAAPIPGEVGSHRRRRGEGPTHISGSDNGATVRSEGAFSPANPQNCGLMPRIENWTKEPGRSILPVTDDVTAGRAAPLHVFTRLTVGLPPLGRMWHQVSRSVPPVTVERRE